MFGVDFHLWQWCLIFSLSAIAVFGTSKWLVSATDTIGEHTGLSKGFLGAVMLATATSLPEIFTGISAVTLTDSPDLAVGTVFGSNMFNLMIIGMMELTILGPSLLTSISKPTKLSLAVSGALILVAIIILAIMQHSSHVPEFAGNISTAILIAMYGSLLWLLHKAEPQEDFSQQTGDSDHVPSLTKAIWLYTVSTLLIALASIGLSIAGENIGLMTGVSASFIGSLLIAFSTSLPEVATSFAALRIGSADMAVSNMTGSNLFNTGIVLFTSDVAFQSAQRGSLLSAVSSGHIFTAIISLAMTIFVTSGAYFGSGKRKKFGTLTIGPFGLIALFLIAQYWLFTNSSI